MRTTVAFDPHTLEQAKQRAREAHLSLSEYVELAVREKTAQPYAAIPPSPDFPTFKGGALQPGIDLLDGRALADVMDGL